MSVTKEEVYLARTADAAGYWGKSPDGPHHAIASCCDVGAGRFGVFAVYRGPVSMTCEPIHGALQWNTDPANPGAKATLEGIYTAGGVYLAESLAALAEAVRDGSTEPDEYALDRQTIRALKDHKPA